MSLSSAEEDNMSGYTYPAPAPTTDGTSLDIHHLLKNPSLVARRLRTLLEQRYISDALLTGRFTAVGGSIAYETGETIDSGENPRAVAPGAEYPLVSLTGGDVSLAKTTKWGQDTIVTDEAIARLNRNPVDRAFTKLANQSVKYVDSITMSAISSAVTNTQAASASWRAAATTAEQILTDVMTAQANVVKLDEGYMPDTVVLDDLTYAHVMAKFIASGFLPQESRNAALNGEFPRVRGLLWLPTNHGIGGEAVLADTEQLGGMADEDLGGPGYARVNGIGVETKSIREDVEDRYRLRCRRVTVPVILEPQAARRITGVSA
jgi:hypothetical protein